MLKLRALLILSFSILLAGVIGNAESKRFEEMSTSLDNEVPLDFLTFSSGKEVEAMFGYEIVEFLHRQRVQCSITRNKEELKFTENMDKLMRYFKHTKRTVIEPEFEKLAKENKKDIEENFHDAFKDIEVTHLQKLSRMQTRCDEEIEMYMDDRLELIMDYATTLHQADKATFTKLMASMKEYQAQLENGLNDCIVYMQRNNEIEHFEKAGLFYDLCYGNEVVILDKLITKFQTLAQELTGEPREKEIVRLPVNPKEVVFEKPKNEIVSPPEDLEDDEDSDYEPSGDGVPEKTSSPPQTEKQDPVTAILNKITRSPTTTPPKPTTFPGLVATTADADLKKKIAEKFFNSLAPGPVIIQDQSTKSTTPPALATTANVKKVAEDLSKYIGPGPVIIKDPPYPDVAEKAFQKVKAMNEASEDDESSESSKSPLKFQSEEKDLNIELPGVNVEINENGVKVDAQGVGEGVIIFDPVPTTEAPEHDHHNKHDFKSLFLIYFFATLGVLLAITMCVLLIVIVRIKLTRKSSSKKKDQPLLSEEDKIALLKQSGYVNPTYKFFDEVKDV